MEQAKQIARKSQGASAPRAALALKGGILGTGNLITRIAAQKRNNFVIIWTGVVYELCDLCVRCHNGGDLQLCDTCDAGTCTLCIIMSNPSAAFICVPCWKSELPYPHRISGEYTLRTSVPKLNLSRLAVISFVLAGLEDFGDPTKAAFDALYSYLKGNIIFFRITFDFSSPASVKKSIAKLIIELESPEHKGSRTGGDIHTIPDNRRSEPLGEVLDRLLTPRLRKIFKRGGGTSQSLFFLHSCGYVVLHPRPRSDLNAFASKSIFKEVIAFDQRRLQPALTYTFMTDACNGFFLYGRKSVARFLSDHHVFGGHTGLVIFTEQGANKFLWCHPIARPFGERISSQCKACMHPDPRFKKERADPGSQTPANYDRDYFLKCKSCKARTYYHIPPKGTWLDGRAPGDDHHGAWLKVPLSEDEQS
ncbi:hypothetical protein BKA70DRAFT_1444968 [Coprinopsis sp. MPI-PUGE-AT-0042]|nr:hypothetical protein BKA70DRAFT_1444968 [Coprinopsis sp. MPI-PUGE-AT-0042]